MNAIDVLIKYWGYTGFRLKQEEIIQKVIKKEDILALLPTGGGKSICYQIPALMNEGICLVISPLISLMNEQSKHLQSKGIKSEFINSSMHHSEIDTILTNCIYGGVKFLYLSPEKLQNRLVQNRITEMNINLITVDEAHCISEWGHNFRPAYRHVAKIRSILSQAPILALTATATSDVTNDIQENLLFKKKNLIKSSFIRRNMSYVIEKKKDKKSRLLRLLNKVKSSVIIYVRTRKETEELSSFLITQNFSASYYHAGLSNDERSTRQEKWTKNQSRIIVATNAFGMGINKADVKLVVHMYIPATIEAYFQESGRAGRDNKTAYSFLIINDNDISENKKLLELKYPTIKEIVKVYQNIANYLQIALGDFPESPIPFDIGKFSHRYKINNTKTHNALRYLEREELIKISNTPHSPSKIKINISMTQLYNFQISNKSYDSFIKFLLRSYSNIFNHLVIINEKKIANHLNCSTDTIKKILTKLKKLEILEYQEENTLSQLIFLQARADLETLQLNEEEWRKRKYHEQKKLNTIIHYINTKDTCRSKLLLDYFGEEISEECGACDVCINKKRNNT